MTCTCGIDTDAYIGESWEHFDGCPIWETAKAEMLANEGAE